MDDSQPPEESLNMTGNPRDPRRAQRVRQESRRHFCAAFLRRLRSKTEQPGDNTTTGQISTLTQGMPLHSRVTPDSHCITVSHTVDNAAQIKRQEQRVIQANGDEQDQAIADESSFESFFAALQADEAFVQQQQAIMNQIQDEDTRTNDALHVVQTSRSVAPRPNDNTCTVVGETSVAALKWDTDLVQHQHAIIEQIYVGESQSHDRLLREVNHQHLRASASIDSLQDEDTMHSCARINLDDDSNDSNDNFLRYLNDLDIVEEQRRIMDNILNSSPHSLTGHAVPPSSLYASALASTTLSFEHDQQPSSSTMHSSTTRHVSDKILGCIEEAVASMQYPREDQEQSLPSLTWSSSDSDIASSSPVTLPTTHRAVSASLIPEQGMDSKAEGKEHLYTIQCEQDVLVELYQGKMVQVRGTNNTWKNIAKGTATLVQCPVCFTILQVGSSAKLLFCTMCQAVSPIGVNVEAAADDRADSLIAAVVQQQEIDVAFAKEMAKYASTKK